MEHAGHCLQYSKCWIPHYLCNKCVQGNFMILKPFSKSPKHTMHLSLIYFTCDFLPYPRILISQSATTRMDSIPPNYKITGCLYCLCLYNSLITFFEKVLYLLLSKLLHLLICLNYLFLQLLVPKPFTS